MSLAHTATQWLKYLGSNFRCTCGGIAFVLAVLYLLVKAVAARILGTTVCCLVVTLETNGLCCLDEELCVPALAGIPRLLEPLPFLAET